ncbi:MAG: hypothetical protein IH971_08820 [Candidatus Marinimicrobia bacterium]|nr:hypothetical protein [Candidatus Neomarinimicrobiota bacterium]
MRYNPEVLRSFVCLLLLLLFNPLDAQQIKSLAVLDFEARGIASHEAASLTDWLRSDIVKISTVPVVERREMLSILREQDLQLTGCVSDECVVKIGQILGVSHILAGSIGRVGSSFSIVSRTIDVETGRIVDSVKRKYRGNIDGLYDEMTPIAWELLGKGAEYKRLQREQREAAKRAQFGAERRRKAAERARLQEQKRGERELAEQQKGKQETVTTGTDDLAAAIFSIGGAMVLFSNNEGVQALGYLLVIWGAVMALFS